jgi:F0F1-type ATP synthase assembly protein I
VFPRRGKQVDLWAQIAFYTSLGFILPVATVGGYILGWYLDQRLHTEPALAVVMGILGAAAGIYEVLRIVTRASQRASGDDSENRSDPS